MGGSGAACVAGCVSSNGVTGDEGGFVAQVSFPVIYDFARNIIPEDAEAENLVPVGQHGHGWEPSPDVQRAVTTSDAFIYVFEGFQPWADDMVTGLRRDHSSIGIVEAGADVELLKLGEDGGHNHNGEDEHDEEGEAEHEEGEHDGAEGQENDDGEGGHDHGDEEEHENAEDREERGNDHGEVDPHFWLDPRRTKTAVGTVADGLRETHGEEGYADKADAYKSRLDDLHNEFESSLSDASKDTVLVAGHNAFAYLGARYGFRVETLTGIAPDEQPSPRDIKRAQELIDTEGIEYVLSPVFESDRAAQSLVEDTTAEEVLPVTAFAGFRQEWLDKDWGYVEVMRNVNLASLERALEA